MTVKSGVGCTRIRTGNRVDTRARGPLPFGWSTMDTAPRLTRVLIRTNGRALDRVQVETTAGISGYGEGGWGGEEIHRSPELLIGRSAGSG